MTRMRIDDDGGEDDTTTMAAVLDQIWARARTTVTYPDLGTTHGRERRELGCWWRLRERCARVEAVLEAMREAAARWLPGEEDKRMMEGEKRGRYIGGTFCSG
jgi:hypothetical protein